MENKRKELFPIKGFSEGLLITLNGEDWESTKTRLLEQIDGNEDFFKGGKVGIEVGERVLHAAEVSALRNALADRNVKLFAVLSKSNVTDAVAESLGLSTRRSVLKKDERKMMSLVSDGEEAIIIRRTLRSGASIKHPGHVIIAGDVNPGAEIFASGSIYVWGKMRGSAHAGMEGDETATISALAFSPLKMRIANLMYKQQKLFSKSIKYPSIATVVDGRIVIERCDEMRKQSK